MTRFQVTGNGSRNRHERSEWSDRIWQPGTQFAVGERSDRSDRNDAVTVMSAANGVTGVTGMMP